MKINFTKNNIDKRHLQALVMKPDVGNGPELKEFLGYHGDAHIAFVRKAPESSIPRIDQMPEVAKSFENTS